jgi:hypothetical protein
VHQAGLPLNLTSKRPQIRVAMQVLAHNSFGVVQFAGTYICNQPLSYKPERIPPFLGSQSILSDPFPETRYILLEYTAQWFSSAEKCSH